MRYSSQRPRDLVKPELFLFHSMQDFAHVLLDARLMPVFRDRATPVDMLGQGEQFLLTQSARRHRLSPKAASTSTGNPEGGRGMKVKSHIRAGSGAFAEAENSARQSNYSSVSQDIN
jgi:hypothetical protein